MVNLFNVAIYSRKSKYSEKGESIKNQVDECKQYANSNFNVDEFFLYEDEGYSGGTADRPRFKALIEDALNKKYNALICYRLDRISRNILDFSSIIELLQSRNIAFISIREHFDTSTPMGRAMMYIASVFAQLERETIAERVRDNMLSLAKSGRWLGGTTPLGYISEAVIFYDAENNKRKMFRLAALDSEIDIVREVYEKYLQLGTISKLEKYCISKVLKSKWL